jgi:HTH-type transcriptional regulator/antitoxin HipB
MYSRRRLKELHREKSKRQSGANMTITKDEKTRDDLDRYIASRMKRSPEFAKGFYEGYEKFKIGVLLKQAREEAGLTQTELARRIRTKKSAISRIENHAEDIKVSTLERAAIALGKKLRISLT